MTDRHTVDTITSDALNALYARIETLEHVAAGNKRHVQAIVPELEQARAERDRFEAAWQSARLRATHATQRAEYRLGRLQRRRERIRKLEQHLNQAEQRLARIRDMADAWEHRLPATIRTATAAEAVRNAAAGDYRPVMFGMSPAPADDDQAVTVAPGVAVIAGQPTAGTKEFAEQERARFERLYTRETVRADKAERDAELANAVTAQWKQRLERRTTTLRNRAERAEAAIEQVREALESLHRTVAHDPRDWGQDKRDAWIWGIVCGWECEEQHDHDWICGRDSALREAAARHQWANEDVDRLKTYRRAVATLTAPPFCCGKPSGAICVHDVTP